MKETNLNIFYQFGESLDNLQSHLQAGMGLGELHSYLVLTEKWVLAFLKETEELMPMLKETRISAKTLLDSIQNTMKATYGHWMKKITPAQIAALSDAKEEMEKNFEREHRNLCVFTVTRKGIYDTHLLIEEPELKFPEKVRGMLPPQMLYDLKQAARCLAFETPTACAFHVCRGTEAVMLAYYELLTKHPWTLKKKDWKIYIDQLCVEKAPQQITTRLEEIRLLDRNAYIHPDTNVSLDEAPNLFELCTNVVSLMGLEMSKLTP